jgi:hypothetical protein
VRHSAWTLLWHCDGICGATATQQLSPRQASVIVGCPALSIARKTLHKRPFEVRFDTAFAPVIRACATVPRPQQPGTWITADMIAAYCRLQDQFGLLACMPLTKIPQELKEPDVTQQVAFAHATKHAQILLEQRKQTFRPILMHVSTRILLPRVIDELVYISLECLVAARRVRVEPTTRVHCHIGCFLYRLHCEIFGRLDDDRALATDPGDPT